MQARATTLRLKTMKFVDRGGERLRRILANPRRAARVAEIRRKMADGDAATDSDESSTETDYLLRSPENARRLMAAIERDKGSQPAPSDATEAPTKHRPEGSDEQ